VNICHFIASQGLGRGEFYIDLINEMIKNKDIKINLLVPSNSKFIDRVDKRINILEYKSGDSRNNPFLYIELYKIFKKYSFDIVHTHFAKSTEIFYRLNKILNLKHIATKHNPRKGNIFNKIKYVTAVSNDVAKSINHKNVKIIYNGLLPEKIIHKNESNKVFTISAIGRLDKIKGFDILINEVSKIDQNFLLNIVGEGEEFNSLSKIIKEKKLNNKVKLIGFKKDIPNIISQSDLVVMSSHSEGFSLVMLESLFYGKVFISTKVSGSKDILSDDLLINDFNISEKISDVILNYEKYKLSFEKIKKQYSERFLLDNVVKEYFKFYKNILKG